MSVDAFPRFHKLFRAPTESEKDAYQIIHFTFQQVEETTLTRHYERTPFVPNSKADRDRRCDEILHIQAMGLKKRLAHTHCTSAVIGISGGLDSTLALLVTAKAFDLLGLDRSGIVAVTSLVLARPTALTKTPAHSQSSSAQH